jgi:enterochelin esterase-like enzyme
MKRAFLILATLFASSALPAFAQPPQGAPAAQGAQAGRGAPPPLVIDTTPPVEDFKRSVLNQLGRQYPEVNSQRRVRFRVVAPEAQNVAFEMLGGNARYPMTKGADGAWVGVSNALDEGFHYYQIIIDGAGVPDPNSLYFFGANKWGSGLEVPAHDEDFYALKDVPHGQLREVRLYAKSAKAFTRCFVYTPPDYDKGSKRYPVLYLQHGGGENEYGWGSQGYAGLIMDNLIAAGKIRPFLIVMSNGGGGAPGAGRGAAPAGQPGAAGRGGTGAPAGGAPAGAGRGAAPGAQGGAAAPGGPGRGMNFNFSAFEHLLIDDIIPYVDANFRTQADAAHRAMAGLSMGGMQTHAIAPAHLDKFSHIGLFSGGSIPVSEIKDIADFTKKVRLVFVSSGSRENGAASKANVEALVKAGVRSVFYESPETAHEWLTWRRALYQFAPLLFQ